MDFVRFLSIPVFRQDKCKYRSYLHLEKILNSQFPRSATYGQAEEHDETLFIIIHQGKQECVFITVTIKSCIIVIK